MAEREQPDGWRQWMRNMAEATAAATGLTPAPTVTITDPMPFSAGFSSQPQFDVIEHVPEDRKDLFRSLRQRRADAYALMVPFADIQEASAKKTDAANALKRLTDHSQDGGLGFKDDDRSVIEAKRQLNKATREFELIKRRSEDRTAAWQAASGAVANAEPYLRDGRPPGTTLLGYDGPDPKQAKGEASSLDAVDNRRRRVRELKADIHRVRSSCYTKPEAMAVVSAAVESWGSNGIDTSATIEHLSQPTIPTKTVQAMVHNVPDAPAAVVFVEVPDVAAILSTVLKDQFIAWLAADVDRNADPKGALSHEARQQQEAELMGDLLAVEREESFFVWKAQSQNLPCEHRADISPLALLGLKLVTTPRADAAPETTAGYSWPMRR